MNRKTLVAISVAVGGAYLLLALVGWTAFVVMHPVDRARLSRLAVTTPPAGFTKKPASANQVAASSSPYSEYKTIAKKSSGSTGAYSVSWTSTKSADDSATFLISYLPSAADAAKIQSQAKSLYLAPGSFKSENYQYVQAINVAGVPGAVGSVYKATGTATTPPVAGVAFTTGRVQILELIGETGTPAGTGQSAAALAQSEYAHLTKALPGFGLQRTSIPLVASLIYWGVAAGIAVLAVAVPLQLGRVRRRRKWSKLRRERRQQQVRGSKIARRQARPPARRH